MIRIYRGGFLLIEFLFLLGNFHTHTHTHWRRCLKRPLHPVSPPPGGSSALGMTTQQRRLCLHPAGINTYGWRQAGVNHVLIFELNPRNNLSHQHLFEVRQAKPR